MTTSDFRIEKDSMGEMRVPAHAYYGASTMRAVLNFPISERRLQPPFIHALGRVKQAAASVNESLSLLPTDVARAIASAAQEVAEGRWDAEFVVDVFQSGSGTSTNMNANEVIAARASELLTGGRIHRVVHPNDQVNLCQSSNDVIPAAIQIACLSEAESRLKPALEDLAGALDGKREEFWEVIKTGRTHLQDATPVRLGQEFQGYASQVRRALRRLEAVSNELVALPLGGTAVGTGINSHPGFGSHVASELAILTGLPLRETEDHFAAQSNIDGLLVLSGVLRAVAVALMKIGNDVRWLGSGPRAGLGELALPEVQPGSSIMPGKVNPVIVESMLQACAQVIGNDASLAVAAQGSHFELNMMLPLAGYNLLDSIGLLAASAANFSERCVSGLTATPRGPALLGSGLALATALVPHIGYDAAAAIAKEGAATGEGILEVSRRRTQLAEDELQSLLDPAALVSPGLVAGGGGT